jgi:hypothetical protein
MRDGRRKGRP